MAANPTPNAGRPLAPPEVPDYFVAGLPAQGDIPTYTDVGGTQTNKQKKKPPAINASSFIPSLTLPKPCEV